MNFFDNADAFSTAGLPTTADEWQGFMFDPQAEDASEDRILDDNPFKDRLPPLPESPGLSLTNEEANVQDDSGADFFAQYVDLDGDTLQDTSNGCSDEGTIGIGDTAGEKGATSRQYCEYEEVTVEASADLAAENESTVGRHSHGTPAAFEEPMAAPGPYKYTEVEILSRVSKIIKKGRYQHDIYRQSLAHMPGRKMAMTLWSAIAKEEPICHFCTAQKKTDTGRDIACGWAYMTCKTCKEHYCAEFFHRWYVRLVYLFDGSFFSFSRL
ncbi:hypothetical protein ACEPAG_5790 [Sanghuangporus baumii]